MKLTNLLPLVALTTAFVVVDEAVLSDIPRESKQSVGWLDRFRSRSKTMADVLSQVEDCFHEVESFSGNAIDKALNAISTADEKVQSSFLEAESWINEESILADRPRKPPHHKKPPHRHHEKPNETIYELISSSKYTTKLAKLIDEYDDLVDILNGTSANITLFAPTDKAFEKIPHHKKPSKELIRNLLAYHVSPDFYPAGRILSTHTIPSTYHEERLGGEPQRLRVGLGLFKGLNINFFSKIIAVNIFATNGVIHGVDTIILPPPPIWKILELAPGEFSTLLVGLTKTGLFDSIKEGPHTGGTFFAPSNGAFKKLGPRINAFLFSSHGEKYLKALLKYHVVANQTLYSDAFYKAKADTDDVDAEAIPKGKYHLDLPTLLDGKSLSIDIARWGGFITIKINGFNGVALQDAIASDGNIHVVSNVLIPPKTPGGAAYDADDELTVEDLKERLEDLTQEYQDASTWWEL